MTADSRLVCRRCGFANVPGDQFCGSCGAFLEWEGEPVTVAGAASTPPEVPGGDAAGEPRDPDVPVVRAAGTPHGQVGPLPAPMMAPILPPVMAPILPSKPGSGTGAGAGAGAGGDLVRCPACGIANAATRTFCQSCGTRLADAGRVTPVAPEVIAAAVNAPVLPPTVRTAGGGGAARATPSGRGSVLRWVVLMGILGLAVGVGIVLVGGVLRGSGPSSAATAGPSGAGSAASAGAGSAGASGQAVASDPAPASGGASAAPTAAPKAVALALTGASASSVVGDLPKFQPGRAIDGDPNTCWQEGSTTEKGQWIEVTFDPATVSSVLLTNGYNASRALYLGNHRLKDILVSVNGGPPVKARLKDSGDPQRIKLTAVAGATTLRITIVSVYKSVKTAVAGTPFDDAALGEIAVYGVSGS